MNGSATQPNQILMLDYTESFGDPLVAMLSAPERSRKWAPWMIAANSCGLIERSTGVAQIFFGARIIPPAKCTALISGQRSDDTGAAINSFYTTRRILLRRASAAEHLFGYLTAYVQGARLARRTCGKFTRRREQPFARRVDALVALWSRHGAVYEHASRAYFVSIRHQRRRLAGSRSPRSSSTWAKPRSLRSRKGRELTIRSGSIFRNQRGFCYRNKLV